ncbi:MAG: histidine phosphatase family protein [Patescibacteria group bacterium]|jgi:broad specificity phosphatase PhoE
MKWPNYILFLRHDTSKFNRLRELKAQDPEYDRFKLAYEENPESPETRALAMLLHLRYKLEVADCRTPLADAEAKRAVITGQNLRDQIAAPELIFCSPYERTKSTLVGLQKGWPELANVKMVEEERIRELEHGLSLLYNDWRIYFAFYPEQRRLYEQEGPYWFRWQQGENVPDVRERVRSWLNTLTRDFSGKKILVVSHHLTILALRANLERLDEHEFNRIDEEEKPINCGATLYTGIPDQGSNGRLDLTYYNRSFA